MKIKHLFFFSLILLIIGIFINAYAYISKCENVIKRNVNKDIFMGRRTVVYLVNNVQTYCRPCTDYKLLKEKEGNIVFYVEKDFSDIDIENFRDAFEIRNKDKVLRITDSWKKLIDKCMNKKNNSTNFLIIINKSGKVEKVERF